jgi:hypothetical protein
MQRVIILNSMPLEHRAILLEALTNAEPTSAAQELDHLMFEFDLTTGEDAP